MESAAEPTPSPPEDADAPQEPDAPQTPAAAAEEVDALPVLANGPSVVRPYRRPGPLAASEPRPSLPLVQAAAAAAGGFVAGAALVGLASRRQRRVPAPAKGRRAHRSPRGAVAVGELVQIVGSRSLLVDVHLLGNR